MATQDSRPSSLMLEECFAAGDDRFLAEWIQFSSPEFLVRFLDRWLADTRPWARQQMILYLLQDLNLPGHEVVIKRLCKYFHKSADHEMMAHFMVAFDRLVRRRRLPTARQNPATRQIERAESLFAKPNKTIHDQTGRTAEYGIGLFKRTVPIRDIVNHSENRLFSHRTRNHLRRKVWRYFRWLSYRDASAYVSAITTAITQYHDADFAAGENILDNWSLMHACYFHSDQMKFTAAHANLLPGNSLADLSAAPYQPELWQSPEAFEHLLRIMTDAHSALARVWSMELLQRDHWNASQRIDIKLLLRLLSHHDLRVRQFASDIFEQHQGLANLPLATWLELLTQCDPALLSMLCAAMKKHVSAARLDSPQLVQLTIARPFPVAEFGLELLRQRHLERPLSASELVSLSHARCEAFAGEITTWTLALFNSDLYQADLVIEFFDALSEAMRSAAMDWLESPDARGHQHPTLWARLIETPFDDIRLRVVECLQRRADLPGAGTDAIAPLWCAVLLGVHRGGRTKLKAISQMQAAIIRRPALAAELLPVLAVAIRSLRAPERRSALAAAASLVRQNPDLQADFQQLLPELQWIQV